MSLEAELKSVGVTAEAVEQHCADKPCAVCYGMFDPVTLLENTCIRCWRDTTDSLAARIVAMSDLASSIVRNASASKEIHNLNPICPPDDPS